MHGVSVREVEAYMGMLVHGVLTGLLQASDGDKELLVVSLGLVPIGELARHAEMHQQAVVIQPEKKKLSSSLDIANHLAGKCFAIARGGGRRMMRWQRMSTCSMRLLQTRPSRPRRIVSTSGSSGIKRKVLAQCFGWIIRHSRLQCNTTREVGSESALAHYARRGGY